jgi:uncharacterized protein
VTARVAVTVAYAAPGVEALARLALPAGAPVDDAVAASGLVERHGLAADAIAYALFGQRADGNVPLRDGDRVEITRPLVADPKAVRRIRAAGHPVGTKAKPPRPRRVDPA